MNLIKQFSKLVKNALICGHYLLRANDLHAAVAVYHTFCFFVYWSTKVFRNGKSFPKKYKNESSSVEPPAKCGKPVNVDQATAFNHVVEYLQDRGESLRVIVQIDFISSQSLFVNAITRSILLHRMRWNLAKSPFLGM